MRRFRVHRVQLDGLASRFILGPQPSLARSRLGAGATRGGLCCTDRAGQANVRRVDAQEEIFSKLNSLQI